MQQIQVRFPPSLLVLIHQEAEIEGISAAQFIRDATLLRIGFRHAQRGDYTDAADRVQEILDQARKDG